MADRAGCGAMDGIGHACAREVHSDGDHQAVLPHGSAVVWSHDAGRLWWPAESWDSAIATPELYERLPPDLTPGVRAGQETCWHASFLATIMGHPDARPRGVWNGWGCTRRAWHTGRHAAGDGVKIRAVWS